MGCTGGNLKDSGCIPVELAFNTIEPSNLNLDLSPVIFLHGITGSKENWGEIPQFIADETGRKVYAIDARNHGDTGWSDEFTFDANCVDILNFMDVQGIAKAILVGHSMGGITAYKAALKAPEKVEKFVVEDMTVKQIPQSIFDSIAQWLTFENTAIQELPPNLTELEAKNYIIQTIYANVSDEIKEQSSMESQVELLNIKPTSDGRYAFKSNHEVIYLATKNAGSLMKEDFEGLYEGPVCVVYGKQSPFLVGEDEDLIKGFFPNVEMVCLDNATHTVHSDNPEEFKDVVLKFILKE